MSFWKTSFWAMIAAFARLFSQFVVAKIIAVFAGAATFGVFGQLQSFVNLIQLGSGGIVNGGLTKYTSEYHNNPEQLVKLIHTAIKFAFYASLVTGAIISVFCRPLSYCIFQSYDYWWVLLVFGMTLFGYTLNQMFLSVFNGLNQMLAYASISILSAFISIILIGVLTYFYHTEGALLGFVLSQFFLFLVSIFYIKKLPVQIKLIKSKVDFSELKRLLVFSSMAVTSAISLPLAQIFLRGYVAHFSGWTDVGYWQAILRVSDGYLLVLTMIISTYAMPKYSRIIDKSILKNEVFSVALKLVPMAATFAFAIYFFRDSLISILFSEKFLVMRGLFFFQLIGDVAKIASWVVASVLLAKTQIRTYITLEVVFTVSYLLLSVLFFNVRGLVGLTEAFALNYFVYFLFVFVWFLRFVKR